MACEWMKSKSTPYCKAYCVPSCSSPLESLQDHLSKVTPHVHTAAEPFRSPIFTALFWLSKRFSCGGETGTDDILFDASLDIPDEEMVCITILDYILSMYSIFF